MNILKTTTTKTKHQPQKRCDFYGHDLLKQVQKQQHQHHQYASYHRSTYDNNNHPINYNLNISNNRNDNVEQPNYLSSSTVFTKAPPFYKNIDGKISKSDAYIENLRTPIKMQQQEFIIEHSQLVLQRNGNRTETNATHQSDHYTQVTNKRKKRKEWKIWSEGKIKNHKEEPLR